MDVLSGHASVDENNKADQSATRAKPEGAIKMGKLDLFRSIKQQNEQSQSNFL